MRERSQIKVHVGGQVHCPGIYPLPPGATVADAIRKAGGATEFGSLFRVAITRGDQPMPIVNLRGKEEGPALEDGDVVEVPQKMVIGR